MEEIRLKGMTGLKDDMKKSNKKRSPKAALFV